MSHKGQELHSCKATDLCGRPDWPRVLDKVGSRRFSGAANAARGRPLQGAQALILMGDWCATVQPMIENQVCGELSGWEDRFGKEGNTTSLVGFCLCLLTGVANG